MSLSRVALWGAVLALCPLAARADEAPAKKKAGVAAHIKLSGSMDEKAPTSDALFGVVGETFEMRLDRIRKVGTDKAISALLLEIDHPSIGWGKTHELTRAIAEVRASGKKVYAYIEGGGNADYMLALACDDVCAPDAAWLMLTGVRMEVTFYKGLLDKLGVKAEPYTRENLSEPNRKQLSMVLDDFFDNEMVARVVAGRKKAKFTPAAVKKLIDAGPYSARAALKAGLIDRVAYFDDYDDVIKADLGVDTLEIRRDFGKKKHEEIDIFGLYKKLMFGSGTKVFSSKVPKVAVIYASGAIVSGKSGMSLLGGESVGSETLIAAIRQAEKDETVKAIVLRIDSPGGSALASDLIWKELRRCKKPVLASMSDVAASGGYYIAMAAGKIYAEPGTITGSIGVVGGKMALRGVYDKLGIKTEVLSRGANSGLLSSSEPFSDSEREAFRGLMSETYDIFVDKALEGRARAGKKMTREELLKLAGGRIWTGRQAKANGLIDELGTLEEVIAAAAKLGGLPATSRPELLQLPKSRGLMESLLDASLTTSLRKVPGLTEKLRGVDTLIELRRDPVWAIAPFRVEVK
jgi:protease-4